MKKYSPIYFCLACWSRTFTEAENYLQKQCQKQQQIELNCFNLFQSLESISKELVAKLQTRLAFWDVNTTLIGDVLVEMVCDDLSRITREDFSLWTESTFSQVISLKLALLKNCSLTFDFCHAVFLFDDVWTIFQVKEEREWGMKVIICAYWLSWRIPTMHSSFSYSSHQLVGSYICQLSLWFFLWNYMWGPTGHLIIRFMNNYVYCLMIRSGSFFLWLRMFQISPDLFFSFFLFHFMAIPN